MPTAFTHAAAGITAAYVLSERRDSAMLWIYVILLSVMADFDVIAFSFGIPYAHTFGHRGFFHSLVFALIISVFFSVVYPAGKGRLRPGYLRLLPGFMIAASLHPLLDMLTSGGLGIGLFIPFDDARLFSITGLLRFHQLVYVTFFLTGDWRCLKVNSGL